MTNYRRLRTNFVKQRDAKFEDKKQNFTFSYKPKKKINGRTICTLQYSIAA